jgi:hypothetical protein
MSATIREQMKTIAKLETKIVRLVKECGVVSHDELVGKIQAGNSRIFASHIRCAVWSLVCKGKLAFNGEYSVVIPGRLAKIHGRMTPKQQKAALEKNIICLVKEGRSMGEIIHKLWKEPFTETSIRQTVWQLVDRGMLTLNEKRKIVIREQ